ncbi:hypothetical protein [Rickettsiella endosymbiont of Miltochrista miniata]|uniref:hypothetical protein n=1 Tax=Rickettsiella endosymbiont of Miltochrista miniata TaxID=3066239 RepID=UPI00313BFDF2
MLINVELYNPKKDKVLELIRICTEYKSAKILLFDNSAEKENEMQKIPFVPESIESLLAT